VFLSFATTLKIPAPDIAPFTLNLQASVNKNLPLNFQRANQGYQRTAETCSQR
jgi:hypothetical protein